LAKPKGLILEEDLVAQEFDLEEITGRDFSEDEPLLFEIGEAVADFVRDRSASNKGIGGKTLPKPYSKVYQESADFKLFGKSANDVNMRLTGDMLDSIEIIDAQGSKLLVGITDENAPKAHGHMTGKNGQVPKMKREFFGLTADELNKVLKEFKSDIKKLPKAGESEETSAVRTLGDLEAQIESIGESGDLFTFEES